jgi:hypothetical protein
MKKFLGVALAASLLPNAVLLLQRRREQAPEPVVRTRLVERDVAPVSPLPEAESVPRTLPTPAPEPAPAPTAAASRPLVSLAASPAVVEPGATVRVTCIVSSGVRSEKHWVGLFPIRAHVFSHIDYRMVDETSEPFLFQAPQKPGDYEFRYVLEDDRTSVAASNPIRVPGEVPVPPRIDIRAGEAVVKCGADIPAGGPRRTGSAGIPGTRRTETSCPGSMWKPTGASWS